MKTLNDIIDMLYEWEVEAWRRWNDYELKMHMVTADYINKHNSI